MEQKAVLESASSVDVENPLQRYLVFSTQLVIYPILLLVRLLFVRFSLHRNKFMLNTPNPDSKVNYVLYANHQSKLDPFIICSSLPFSAINQLLPYRFLVENSYFIGRANKWFLNAIGGFPAHYQEGRSYGLDRARGLMAANQTIVIFPQGTRTRRHIAKSGISVLATEPNTLLIPIRIDWKHRWHCEVLIGAPIRADANESPDQIMRHVYDLKN